MFEHIIAAAQQADLKKEEDRLKVDREQNARLAALSRGPGRLGTTQLLEKLYGDKVETSPLQLQLPQPNSTNTEPAPHGKFPPPPGFK